jgi:hypothetical protein
MQVSQKKLKSGRGGGSADHNASQSKKKVLRGDAYRLASRPFRLASSSRNRDAAPSADEVPELRTGTLRPKLITGYGLSDGELDVKHNIYLFYSYHMLLMIISNSGMG